MADRTAFSSRTESGASPASCPATRLGRVRWMVFFADDILQMTHSYASLFSIAASAYLLALVALCLLIPGLSREELAA